MIGPHNNKLHRVTNVFDSFRKKFTYINNLIQKNLNAKLDQLTSQIHNIELYIDEVKSVKNSIEREIRAEYSELIENLRSEEGKKLAILQYESSILQKDINKILDIISIIGDISSNENPDMIGFLLKYKNINETIELSLAKPFKKSIDVATDDFPRDLEIKKQKLEKYEKIKRLIKVKDDIIWNLLNDRRAKDELEILQLKEKTHNEIAEWVKLSDKYAHELKKYNLVCHFCGCYIEENTINELCTKNSEENVEKHEFTEKNPPSAIINTKRHFFAVPKTIPVLKNNTTIVNHNSILNKIPLLKTQDKETATEFKTTDGNNQYKNPFENNIYNDSRISSYRSRSTSPPSGNLRYSDEIVKGI